MGHTLVVGILFLLSISSASVLFAALHGHQYEEGVPFSVFGIILILYVTGLFQALRVGVFIVLGLAGGAYGASVALALAKKRFSAFLKSLFTPCLGLFFLLFLFLVYCDQGLLAYHADDFSHWADILRVMLRSDGFGVGASARSYFGTYPPALSLIQYFFVSLHSLLFPAQPLAEHLIYLASQLMAFSLFLPFLHRLRGKSVLYLLLFSLGCFIVPLTFHEDFFYSLYTDPMVGLLAGFCFAYPYLGQDRPLQRGTFWLALFVLVLSKGVGGYFALMAALAFLATRLLGQGTKSLEGKEKRKALWQPAIALAMVFLTYGTWQFFVGSHQPLFSDPWTGGSFLSRLGGLEPYQKTVIGTFADRLFVVQFFLGGHRQLGVCFLFLFPALLILLAYLLGAVPSLSRKQNRVFIAMAAATVLLYMAGLCYSYLFQFSPEEAEYLHSFSRYGAVPLTMLLMTLFGLLCLRMERATLSRNALLALLALLVVAFPYEGFRCLFKHEKVIESQAIRAPYDQVTAQVLASVPEEEANIYLISQGQEDRDDFWFLRSLLRPLVMDNHNYYISPNGVLGPEGIRDITKFTKEQSQAAKISAAQWQAMLRESYDYVLLFRLDGEFVQAYAPVFLEPETIREGSLYRVREDGRLLQVPLGQ